MNNKKLEQLTREGFCVFENILDPEMVSRLRVVTEKVLDAQTEAHFKDQRSTGSMVRVDQHPFMAELIAYPKALETLAGLGFDDPKWWSGYIISKPPYSPPLFWHQDGLFWDDSISYTAQPQQWFLMYYLVDTTPENGCLRLIPGSHLNRHPLHDQVSEAHREELRQMTDSVHPAYKRAAGEVDVPVKAGDLVIGDARLLHAAHGNQSEQRRTVITLWYFPDFAGLPETIQAYVAQNQNQNLPEAWLAQTRDLIEPLRPVYEGDAEPIRNNRTPGKDLK
jgi:hypothetical protein